MTLIEWGAAALTSDHFAADTHANRYLGGLLADPSAFRALLDLLNDPASLHLMEHESQVGNAALRGVTRAMEADATIWRAVTDPETGPRFRQAVGVAVRLRMELSGWETTGRKGPVPTPPFSRAEKYEGASAPQSSNASRALAALEQIAAIGTDDERRATGDRLDDALRATRGDAGRAY